MQNFIIQFVQNYRTRITVIIIMHSICLGRTPQIVT